MIPINRKIGLFIAGFGLATFFILTLLVWVECPLWVKVYMVFALLGIVYLSWSLTTANNSQANNNEANPNDNKPPMVVMVIPEDTHKKTTQRYSNAYPCTTLHILTIPFKICIRVYRLACRLSTKMQKNRWF